MNPFSRKAKLANEMAHQQSYSAEPYREGMDFTDEAWAYGLRALPGSLANQIQDLGEYTMGGRDRPNKLGNYLNKLTQVNEMGYTPQTEYEAGVAFLPELVYDPAIIAGAPYAAYKGLRNAPKLMNVLADEAGRTSMRNQLGMITWQGSPHKYDGLLDPTKIGTGEGAQAYGYGHYLAESPDVANAYKESLSPGGTVAHSLDRIEDALDLEEATGKYIPSYIIDNAIRRAGKMGGVDQAITQIDELAPQLLKANNAFGDDMLLEKEVLSAYRDKIAVTDVNTGHLYKFDLDDNAIANMLDWDAPISQQQPEIRDALVSKINEWADFMGDESTKIQLKQQLGEGADAPNSGSLYQEVARMLGSDKAASQLFQEAGIPGIKYYDGSSRAAGEGTRNFVVFPGNENLVTPLERNGEPLGILPTR